MKFGCDRVALSRDTAADMDRAIGSEFRTLPRDHDMRFDRCIKVFADTCINALFDL
jgi:hypothetical protein